MIYDTGIPAVRKVECFEKIEYYSFDMESIVMPEIKKEYLKGQPLKTQTII